LLLAVYLSIAVSGTSDAVRCRIAKASLRMVRSAVTAFQETTGRLPSEEEGLTALARKPVNWPDEVPWRIFVDTEHLPSDGWGNTYVYVLDAGLSGGFGVYSCGRDGTTSSNGNDPDDLNTWDNAKPLPIYYATRPRKDPRDPLTIALLATIVAATGVGTLAWARAKLSHRSV
jgi:general secretion pathway protein G